MGFIFYTKFLTVYLTTFYISYHFKKGHLKILKILLNLLILPRNLFPPNPTNIPPHLPNYYYPSHQHPTPYFNNLHYHLRSEIPLTCNYAYISRSSASASSARACPVRQQQRRRQLAYLGVYTRTRGTLHSRTTTTDARREEYEWAGEFMRRAPFPCKQGVLTTTTMLLLCGFGLSLLYVRDCV